MTSRLEVKKSITVYLYNTISKIYSHSITTNMSVFMENVIEGFDFTLTPPPDYNHVWRWVDTEWVELLPINNSDMPYGDEYIWNEEQGKWVVAPELNAYKHLENQALIWERIKQLRQEKITKGVYIPSIDKHFHTDAPSIALYTNIGNSIALGVFEPLNWKTMEGDFIELTEALFKEVHVAIIDNTEAIYAKAEWHKYMMMQADEPLEYNYNDNW